MSSEPHVLVARSRSSPPVRALRFGRYPWFGLAVMAAVVLFALVPEGFAPRDPYAQALHDRLRPPLPFPGSSVQSLLGTDQLGRDVLSRLIYGARPVLLVVVASSAMAGLAGGGLGVLAGYSKGWIDTLVMRMADGTLALPTILLGLLLAVVVGSGLGTVVVAVTIVLWARFARVVRGEVVAVRERPYIEAARALGCAHHRILLVHVVPNVFPSFLILLSLHAAWIVTLEASLSFLGAGIPPPTPAWGTMTAGGRGYIATAWWIALVPGFAIFLVSLVCNQLGDWLRDRLDPRLRGL